jgi:hypothetical protein
MNWLWIERELLSLVDRAAYERQSAGKRVIRLVLFPDILMCSDKTY